MGTASADGGGGDAFAFEIRDRLDRAVIAGNDAEIQRRAGQRANRFLGRAFDQEGEVGSRAETNIECTRQHRLMKLGAAFEH